MLTDEDVMAIEARAEGQRFPAVTGEEVRGLLADRRELRALAAELTEALRQSHDDAVEFGGFVCTGECSVSPLLAKAREHGLLSEASND